MGLNSEFVICQDLSDEDFQRLAKAEMVGIDTETTGLNPNRDLLCLVQICEADGHVTIIKRHDWNNALRLREFLITPNPIKVFHFALFDCGFLFKHLSVEVNNIFCTKIASRLARTYTDKHSLAALVEDTLGIYLDKSQQTTDWYTDDLSLEQLTYAANDVKHLIALKQQLDRKLSAKGVLPTGISYSELNLRCQMFIPTLVQLRLNGWDITAEVRDSVFY